MKTLNLIIENGLECPNPSYVLETVRRTNITLIALVLVLAAPFTIISYFFLDWLTIFPLLGGAFCVFFLVLNMTPVGIFLSRPAASIIPNLLASFYSAYLTDVDQDRLVGLFACQCAFFMLGFTMFSIQEKKQMVITGLVNFLIIVSFPLQNELMDTYVKSNILRVGFLSNFSVVAGIAVMLISQIFPRIIAAEKEEKIAKIAEDQKDLNARIEEMNESQAVEIQQLKDSLTQTNWKDTFVANKPDANLCSYIARNIKGRTEMSSSVTYVGLFEIKGNTLRTLDEFAPLLDRESFDLDGLYYQVTKDKFISMKIDEKHWINLFYKAGLILEVISLRKLNEAEVLAIQNVI